MCTAHGIEEDSISYPLSWRAAPRMISVTGGGSAGGRGHVLLRLSSPNLWEPESVSLLIGGVSKTSIFHMVRWTFHLPYVQVAPGAIRKASIKATVFVMYSCCEAWPFVFSMVDICSGLELQGVDKPLSSAWSSGPVSFAVKCLTCPHKCLCVLVFVCVVHKFLWVHFTQNLNYVHL